MTDAAFQSGLRERIDSIVEGARTTPEHALSVALDLRRTAYALNTAATQLDTWARARAVPTKARRKRR